MQVRGPGQLHGRPWTGGNRATAAQNKTKEHHRFSQMSNFLLQFSTFLSFLVLFLHSDQTKRPMCFATSTRLMPLVSSLLGISLSSINTATNLIDVIDCFLEPNKPIFSYLIKR